MSGLQTWTMRQYAIAHSVAHSIAQLLFGRIDHWFIWVFKAPQLLLSSWLLHWQIYISIGVALKDVWRLLTYLVVQKEKRLRNFSLSRWFHWWAHQDLNLGPKDSGLCSFHYSLDYAFIISIAGLRWVPSSLYTFNSTFTLKLGSALAWVVIK